MFLSKKTSKISSKKPVKCNYYLIFAFLLCQYTFSQQITVDTSVSLQDLIENNLIENCGEISNVESFISGREYGINSYGTFQNNNSGFPLSRGIVLTTGSAAQAGNGSISNTLSQGTTNWGTDPDIETYLGVSNTANATSIEFDFIAITDQIQFNYLLASEEYASDFTCYSSDGFVFLIRGPNENYRPIAFVPGTNDVVTVNNIHIEIPDNNGVPGCPAVNGSYYDGTFSDTNYIGRTDILTASATLIPNTQYHIKLIIADQNVFGIDPSTDSAVFIEANSLYELDLGDDISTCLTSVPLNATIPNPLATYTWSRNNIAIPNATNPTYTATSTGLYSVEINIPNISCTIQDSININIEPELSTNPIPPYSYCDDTGTNQGIFDLTTKDADVLNAIPNPPVNYTIRYYLRQNDSRNNPNNNISSPLTTSNTTVYVRVDNLDDQGCLIYGTIDLEVNTPPQIIQPILWPVCDNDNNPNSITAIDLTQKDDEITGGNPDLSVSYHFTQSGAETDTDIVDSPYTNTNPSETLYIRVTDTTTGCATATGETLTFSVSSGITGISREMQYIDACDKDYDGSATFNLNDALTPILNGLTLPYTYHVSIEDAEAGINPILNPENFVNQIPDELTNPGGQIIIGDEKITLEQRIYLRLDADDGSGCYTVVPFEIHTNMLLTATNLPSDGIFRFCDRDQDGEEIIDLQTRVIDRIMGDVPNISVTLFTTESNRDNNINPIPPDLFTLNSPSRTIYLRIESSTCFEFETVELELNSAITFNSVAPIPYCDIDQDGFASVNFSSLDSTITGGESGYEVSYYLSRDDANTNTNPLPQYYDTGSGSFYARIVNSITRCQSINEFELFIRPAPLVNPIEPLTYCNVTETTEDIRLQDLIDTDYIISNSNLYDIEFFTDTIEAEDFDIANPLNNLDKESFTASTQTLFVRVQDKNSECYTVSSFEVIVSIRPIISNISSYQICVDIGSTEADFYLETKDAEILNGQTDLEVRYYSDNLFANEINKTTPYRSSGAETIYVKLQHINNTDCYDDSFFLLEIAGNPIYNTNFSDVYPPLCQNNLGEREFDLAAKRSEIAQGSTDTLNITFYTTLEDAELGSNNTLPDIYTTTDLQGQFYVRIENDINKCYVTREIYYTSDETPTILSVNIDPICDTDTDGIASFNLNNTIYNIQSERPGLSNNTYAYYEDQALTIQIPQNQISNYQVNRNKTIYGKVTNRRNCSDSMPIPLQVNVPPTLIDIPLILECENSDNIYDLNTFNNLLVSSTTNVNISYHNSLNNAQNNTGIYTNNLFNYPSDGLYSIFARVEDATTGCPSFQEIELQIYPNPIANTPPNYEICDTDFNTTNAAVINLNEHNSFILGSQDPSIFSVNYYRSQQYAEANFGRLNNTIYIFNEDIIYARIENIRTGCFAVSSFQTIINPLPIIPVNDIEAICNNATSRTISAETGNPGDTYFWSTGETTPQITLDITDLGNYWIRVTTPQNCSYRKNFRFVESQTASINDVITVDFSEPNSITIEVDGIGNYEYALNDDEPQNSNVFYNVSLGVEHTITVIDLNGCAPISDKITLFGIPKYFTPNEDGANDTWHITDAYLLPSAFVSIFNRYGKLMQTLTNKTEGWDGNYNGENMPADDYWFVAEIITPNKTYKVKGHFTLKR